MNARRPMLYLLAVALVVLFLEAVSFVAAWALLPTGLLVTGPDASGYDEYLQIRDPLLGWPSPENFGTGEFDSSGSRIVPAYPDPSLESCVALFGDSFTWGDEVEPADAYGNVLATLLNCRVANYGVGGYGTDQAAIRYMQAVDDNAPVVVLGHFADNITRNVNQLRDFIAGGRFGFKPRFTVQNGSLQQIPLPQLNAVEYAEVVDRAAELLPHEFFLPGNRGAAGVMRFPYSLAVARAAAHYRVVAALRGVRPTYKSFYQVDHPSGALQVTVMLLSRAAVVAAERKQRFLVLLIPDHHDLEAVRSGEPTSYAPLAESLEAVGIEVVDAADYFVDRHAGKNFCDLFVSCGKSHFNPAGYRMLAESVHAALKPPAD